MTRTLTLFLFLVFSQLVFSQNTVNQLSGLVLNSANNQVLENVTIAVQGTSNQGTLTDEEGRFAIKTDTLPIVLIVSSIGFETQRIVVNKTDELLIHLISSTTTLPEVVIRAARKIDTVYHTLYNVVDYAFKDDFLVLLVYKNFIEKYELVLLDQNETYLAHYSIKDYKPSEIFKSCLNRLYLTTDFGVYKIELEEQSIRLGDWVDDGTYEQIIEPCILSIDSLLFYRRYLYQGQALKYYAFENKTERTDSITILPMLEDEDNIFRLIEETGNRLPWSGDFWDEQVSNNLRMVREEPYFLKGAFRMFYPKLYAPIIQVDSTICLFNHLASVIQYFDIEGNPIKEVPIQYHKMKRWKKYILHDEFTQDTYTAFHTRWGEYICQIDMDTGTLSDAIPLDLDFIEKVSIRNGVLYFLHRNPYQGAQNRLIQKVRVN